MSRPFQNSTQRFQQRTQQYHTQLQRGGGYILQRQKAEQLRLVKLRLAESQRERSAFREPVRQYSSRASLPPRTTGAPTSGKKSKRVLGRAIVGGDIGGLIFGPYGAAVGALFGGSAAAEVD